MGFIVLDSSPCGQPFYFLQAFTLVMGNDRAMGYIQAQKFALHIKDPNLFSLKTHFVEKSVLVGCYVRYLVIAGFPHPSS